ncbi:MAG: hypothetical protein KGZ88_04395 [Methylomicrobium sp.]|nr:hypothetical protein [Methylomicrobium sp.]
MNDSPKAARNYWKYAFCVLFFVSFGVFALGIKCWGDATARAISNFYGEKEYKRLKYDFDAIAKLFIAFQSTMSPEMLISEAKRQGFGTITEKKNGLNRIQVGSALFAFNQDGKLMWLKRYDEAR